MFSIKKMVNEQVDRVLKRGQRFERFDQIRQRHFWSSYLFAYGAGNVIQSGQYDVFKVIPNSGNGQGYPVALTDRETNWANVGRVPDNQNIAITEVGVTITRPAPVAPAPAVPPTTSIYGNLPAGIQALINPRVPIHPADSARIAEGVVLSVTYLTNDVPLGKVGDFSQPGALYSQIGNVVNFPGADEDLVTGDASMGVPAAAFRRKLEIPYLLQHGETVAMRLTVPLDIPTLSLAEGGAGWAELRVDWWAIESFVEKS